MTNDNWIDVWEKLPKPSKNILLKLKDETFCEGSVEINSHRVVWYDIKGNIKFPTHWMLIGD